MTLADRAAALAARDLPLAAALLAEVVRIPADHLDADPRCGTSNHEAPRLRLLRERIVALGAVDDPGDVGFDDFGNLWWSVSDPTDGVPAEDRLLVVLDGHTDTVDALRDAWREKSGGALDPYDGLVDPARRDEALAAVGLGWVPPVEERGHLLFGRGTADQLGGVVCQVFATRLLRELRAEGALRGITVRACGSVAEEDNDGGGPIFVKSTRWPLGPAELPDVVILTEGTGDARKGALGLYRGQRGRMQLELEVTGRSAHGSMPWEGLNPLEHGAAIVAEAAAAAAAGAGLADDPFLGPGTRTASWARLDTPSDCAVPDRFTVRFDRRLTVGEDPARALADLEALPSVARARAAGLTVTLRVPRYDRPTWTGHRPDNAQIYPGWVTPEDHPAIRAAVETYDAAVTPHVVPATGGGLRAEPRVDRWIFSTDGVGFTVPLDAPLAVPDRKRWVRSATVRHPPMFGFGPGIEQNTHKIGECVDRRELAHVVAFLTAFPATFAATRRPQ